jgi:hypothetical protein
MSDLISALLIEVSKETVINCIEIAKSERVAPGKKVPPQLPPKPMPVDMVNGTHVAPVSREGTSHGLQFDRCHSLTLFLQLRVADIARG